MSLPANIRVNLGVPFPAMVKGGGPVAVSRANGVWTVTLTFAGLAAMPPGTDPTTVQVLVYNTVTKVFQYTTVQALGTAAASKTTTISALNSPYAPLATDIILLVDTAAGPVEIDLPPAATRNNNRLTVKDLTGHAAASNITIKPNGAEKADAYTNAAPAVIADDFAEMTFNPLVGGGWWIG